ncbi:MAG: ACP S-malonyltransferase [Bacillota bacterium]
MLAFLFPGQGSQRVGMGLEFYRLNPSARRVFDRASEVLGYNMAELCFRGSLQTLTATENTQPAIFTCSMAALSILQEYDVEAKMVAGHSVGEFAALVAAGSLDFTTALQTVRKRGRLMASVQNPGAMAAIIGLTEEKVTDICRQAEELGPVDVALFNSPTQLVISGARPAVEKAQDLARQAGALKVTPLHVSSAFHSQLMVEIIPEWEEYVAGLNLQAPVVPVVLNTTARVADSVTEIRQELVDQLTSAVRWTQSVRAMVDQGVTRTVEVGSSKILTSLNRGICQDLECFSLMNPSVVNWLAAEKQRPA